MSRTSPQLATGATLSSVYRIERELGAGGMATVYLADDLKHRRKVAIKVLRADLAASIGAERFLREIEIAAALQHPHILPVHDSGNASGVLYYVMPYVEGETLRTQLRRHERLAITDAVRTLRDVADALAYAHGRGVVHRDIKPENVLVSGRHALVADFGVAKAVSQASELHQLTSAGIALGTPAYMSPEQAAGDPHLDHRADIYSFGVLAYELLAGVLPITGQSPQAILAAHVITAPEPLRRHRPDVPLALEDLVMSCLAKEADGRPQHAEDVVALLETMMTPSGGMQPTSARRIAFMAGRLLRRRRAAIAITVVIAASALGGGMLATGYRAPPARRLIVVAPFDNRTGDSSLAGFGELAASWVADALVRDGAIDVVAPSTVTELVRTDLAASTNRAGELARRTGAQVIVRGEYTRVGDSLEIRGALVDARSGRHLETIDAVRGIPGTSAVLRGLELRATEAVQAQLGAAGFGLGPVSRPASLDAYLENRRGDEYYTQRRWSEAAEAYARAAMLDSMWAWPALNLLIVATDQRQYARADSIIRRLKARRETLGRIDLDVLEWQEAIVTGSKQREYESVKRLYERSPHLWAYTMAYVALRANRPREALLAARNRDTATTWGKEWYAWTSVQAAAHHYLGEHEGELAVVLERRKRDPLAANAFDLEVVARAAMGQLTEVTQLLDQSAIKPGGWESGPGRAYMEFMAHGYEAAAREMLQRAVRSYETYATQPGANRPDSIAYATALFWSRNYAGALAWWTKLAEHHSREWTTQYWLAMTFAALGRREEALRISEGWLTDPPSYCPGCVSYHRAVVLAVLGERREAAALLRQSLTEGIDMLPPVHRLWAGIGMGHDPAIRELLRPHG